MNERYTMYVCNICSQPASQYFTYQINNRTSRTVHFCKDHNPGSKPQGISSKQMKAIDPEFAKRYG